MLRKIEYILTYLEEANLCPEVCTYRKSNSIRWSKKVGTDLSYPNIFTI